MVDFIFSIALKSIAGGFFNMRKMVLMFLGQYNHE